MVQKIHEKEHATFDTRVLSFDTLSLEFRIKHAVLFAGLLVTILVSYGYVQFSPPSSLNDTIRNLVLILGAGVGLTSLIYTALSINALRADKVRDAYIAKLTHSSQFVTAWYSESMVTNTKQIRLHTIRIVNEQQASERARLVRELVEDQELFISARTILNFLEHMAQDPQVQPRR